ncbi:glycoside hydrolase family 32 protein [Enterococcus sp. N249-2]
MLEKEYWEVLHQKQAYLKQKIAQDPWRLVYHLMPETGWMNDPNGLCQFNGTVHFYHQYVPQEAAGGLAPHWGHKTSTDFVSFQEEPLFLSPNHDYDRDGVYSGSAFVEGNQIHFFYTGNVKHPGDHDYTYSGREQNTVHVVSDDGFTVIKQEVVIPHDAYPAGFTDHIRDPKVFKRGDMYYMILGARTVDNQGKILIYESENLSEWRYRGIFFGVDDDFGYMWECPDYFQIDGQDVLLFSPQGILNQRDAFQNRYHSGYILGTVDWETLRFKHTTPFRELDHGFDFYAPQTFSDEQERRILWGWMGLGDTMPEYSNPTVARGWQHAATLPRELKIRDQKLVQQPITELQRLRGVHQQRHIQSSVGEITYQTATTAYEMAITLDKSESKWQIALLEDTLLQYDGTTLTMTHGSSGYGRKHRRLKIDHLKHLHIYVDTSSIEIFLNHGAACITSRVYPTNRKPTVSMTGVNQALIDYWPLINE